MLGNDVVDLGDPEAAPGARHPRFDARVFGPAERDAIARSAEPNRTRWLLWAAKEAAYKAVRRGCRATPFAPVRFEVSLDADGAGRVRHRGRVLAVRTESHGDCIHAVAGADGDVVCAVARVPAGEDPGDAVRRLAQRAIARRLHVDPRALRIGRAARIPRLIVRGRASASLLSLSHHGGFAAFACRFDPALAGGSLRGATP